MFEGTLQIRFENCSHQQDYVDTSEKHIHLLQEFIPKTQALLGFLINISINLIPSAGILTLLKNQINYGLGKEFALAMHSNILRGKDELCLQVAELTAPCALHRA